MATTITKSLRQQADSESEPESDASENERAPTRKETIPDSVDHFLGMLLEALKKRAIPEIHKLYEDTFNKLSIDNYKNKKWPSAEAVKNQISDEPLFIILYKELYYRHIYSRLQVSLDDRRGSWENYCMLLDLIISDLEEGQTLSVVVPPQWIWDILDEFVYHYQTYCATRSKAIKAQKENDVKFFKEHPEVYQTTTVLNYLHRLVRASKVEAYLANKDSDDKSGAFGDETTRLLGYFSLMQLLRMHSLLGDYHLAMKTIQRIDISEEVPLYYRIPACHVTLYYYMGFAYLMMRRYADAIRTFSEILVFLSKTSGVNSLSYQYDAMVKKQDQMYALMLIALALSPRQIDESLEKTIRDKHGEKQARLQRGEDLCFEELFSYACPKFVAAAPPDYDNIEGFNANEAHQRQLRLFLTEMRQQQFLPRIGAYMKLYTAIKTTKLAQLCDMDTDTLRDQLMCVMHKTSQKVRSTGAPLDGEPSHCSEVEFYLDGEMVHINAQRVERDHGEVFLEHILKFQELLKKTDKSEKHN
mmetsp:Transcript_127837/g.368114  ORF Transcript_127837/g.368114 Transcript_127837/m.368114 type:complete len:529 (+) Transcript_127837:89-1675(+)